MRAMKKQKRFMQEEGRLGSLTGDDLLLYCHNSAPVEEDALNVESLDLSSFSLLGEDVNDSETVFLNIQEQKPESYAVSELQLGSCDEETELRFVFPSHKYQIKSASPVSAVDLFREANNNEIVNHEKDEHELVSCTGYGKSASEELYLFDKNLSLMERTQVSNGVTAVSSADSLLGSPNFSASVMTEAPQILQGDHLPAGFIEGLRPLGYKDGPCHERKDTDRGRGSMDCTKSGLLFQDGHNGSISLPHLPEIHVKGKDDISRQYSSYNHSLRYGRLTECIELLEDMDKEGVLDMNKVYHAKFFGLCRCQNAVKEAFRFAKLIPNPTLSTFNMLMSVCASAHDSEGAFRVQRLVQEAGFRSDCKLYTTLISACAKSGKVDQMFEVFHEMVNSGVEPNVHTYGALIDGCARAGHVAKAFGAYGILRSKNVKPDRVIFNALITACGQSGAVERAFDVLAEMTDEPQSLDPDHVTVGALIKSCMNAGQVDRVREVYKMIHQYSIKSTPEVYTIAINSCSQTGDWEFACSIYEDMKNNGVVPDQMLFSSLIDVAGHAGNLDAAFEVLREATVRKIKLGIMVYSSLMGACSNTKNWQKALEVYEEIKARNLSPTVATMNALITALCKVVSPPMRFSSNALFWKFSCLAVFPDSISAKLLNCVAGQGDQLHKAVEVLSEVKKVGLRPNDITYSVLFVTCEKKDDLDVGLMLLSRAKEDGVPLNLVMRKCIIGMCSRRYGKAIMLGEPVLDVASGYPQINSKWTSVALMIYREAVGAGVIPSLELFAQVIGCLKLPQDASLKERLTETLGVDIEASTSVNICSLVEGFGEYDPRAFSLLEEAASLGLVPRVSFKASPIFIDASNLCIHTAEVYLLTVFKGLKYRLAAGAKLPNIIISVPVEKARILSLKGERTVNVAGR
ncbi:hypothetical protein Dimus_002606 [Dionaea muscipula]